MQNLKVLLFSSTQAVAMIIGIILCAKLNANHIVVLVSFWAWLSFTSNVEHDKKILSTIASWYTSAL